MTRKAFDFDEPTEKIIEELQRHYDTDAVGVLKKAIALLETARAAELKGNNIAVVSRGGKYTLIETGYCPCPRLVR